MKFFGLKLLLLYSFLLQAQKEEPYTVIDSILNTNFQGCVVLQKNGETVFEKNYAHKGLKLDEASLFQLGEISQTVIVELVNEAVNSGKINLHSNVVKYLPNFPYENITVKNLVMHSSGLTSNYVKLFHRNYYNDPNNRIQGKNYRFDNSDIYSLIVNSPKALSFNPGEEYDFNPLNYIVISVLLEKIYFKSLENIVFDFFKDNELGFQPKVIANRDTFPNKAFGIKIINEKIFPFDNISHLKFPYSDGTVGHQNIYFTFSNAKKWLKYLQEKYSENEVEKSSVNYYNNLNPRSNYLLFKGELCAHKSYMSIHQNGYSFLLLSNVDYGVDIEESVNVILESIN